MAPFQMFGSIEQIGQIKVTNVVSGDNIRVDFTNEISPFLLGKKFIQHSYLSWITVAKMPILHPKDDLQFCEE